MTQGTDVPERKGSRRWVWVAIVVVIIIGYAATRSATPPTEASRCVSVPAVLLDHIEAGLDGRSLGKAAAVKSRDYENVWMVAAVIEGVGDAGVWGTNDLGGGGLIASVDGYANQFSDWGRLPDASITDDGASEAKACIDT